MSGGMSLGLGLHLVPGRGGGNPLLFLAPLNGSLAFQDRAGGGTLTGSGAVRWKAAEGARTNLVLNPTIHVNGSGYINWSAGLSRVVDADGVPMLEFTADTLNEGLSTNQSGVGRLADLGALTISFDAYVVSGDVDTNWSILAGTTDVAGGNTAFQYNNPSFKLTAVKQRYAINYTPAGAAAGKPTFYFRAASGISNTAVVRIGRFVIESGTKTAEQATYFDGTTGCWLDPITGQLGTAHASPSVSQATAWVEEGTTNLIANPRAESDATTRIATIGSGTITKTRDTTYAAIGSASVKLVCDGTASGQGVIFTSPSGLLAHTGSARPYAPQARLRGSGTVDVFLRIWYSDASIADGAATTVALSDSWQVITPASASSNAAKTVSDVSVIARTSSAQAVTFWATNAQVEDNKTQATSCTDGSLGTGYAWSGTAHASASTRVFGNISFTPNAQRLNIAAGEVVLRANPLIDAGVDQYAFSHFASSSRVMVIRTSGDKLRAMMDLALNLTDTPDWTPNTWLLAGVNWRAGGIATLHKDGADIASSSTPNMTTLGATAYIGANGAASGSLNGLVGPVAIFARPLTARERLRLASLRPEQWHWRMLEAS